ncbi:hypothetical protein HaLaN_18315 [Haematococcus lacustris]|uniref:Uncharacterized protein n=1 Tax=Haematococcus lacustris TaxID=44745 RepID=A0A699ZJ10_HAELA|nr:hypothetical protein HaLaN_18315 [Haematococcus lacustris]
MASSQGQEAPSMPGDGECPPAFWPAKRPVGPHQMYTETTFSMGPLVASSWTTQMVIMGCMEYTQCTWTWCMSAFHLQYCLTPEGYIVELAWKTCAECKLITAQERVAHTTVPQQVAAAAGPWLACLAAACSPGQGAPCTWLAELPGLATSTAPGATTGHHIMLRTGWSRCWLQAERSRRRSTCPAGGCQSAGLVGCSWSSSSSHGCWPLSAELARVVRCSSTGTTLPRSWSVPLGLHTTLQQARNTTSAPHPPLVPMLAAPKNTTSCLARPWRSMDTSAMSSSNCSHAHKAHTWWLTWWHRRPVLGSVQPQPLPCPLGVQVHLPHRIPGGQGGGDVLQVFLQGGAG